MENIDQSLLVNCLFGNHDNWTMVQYYLIVNYQGLGKGNLGWPHSAGMCKASRSSALYCSNTKAGGGRDGIYIFIFVPFLPFPLWFIYTLFDLLLNIKFGNLLTLICVLACPGIVNFANGSIPEWVNPSTNSTYPGISECLPITVRFNNLYGYLLDSGVGVMSSAGVCEANLSGVNLM